MRKSQPQRLRLGFLCLTPPSTTSNFLKTPGKTGCHQLSALITHIAVVMVRSGPRWDTHLHTRFSAQIETNSCISSFPRGIPQTRVPGGQQVLAEMDIGVVISDTSGSIWLKCSNQCATHLSLFNLSVPHSERFFVNRLWYVQNSRTMCQPSVIHPWSAWGFEPWTFSVNTATCKWWRGCWKACPIRWGIPDIRWRLHALPAPSTWLPSLFCSDLNGRYAGVCDDIVANSFSSQSSSLRWHQTLSHRCCGVETRWHKLCILLSSRDQLSWSRRLKASHCRAAPAWFVCEGVGFSPARCLLFRCRFLWIITFCGVLSLWMFLNGWCPQANIPLVCPFQFESEKVEDRFKFQLTIQTNLLSSRCWCVSLASNFFFFFFHSKVKTLWRSN